jgi:general secretion pathway protein G
MKTKCQKVQRFENSLSLTCSQSAHRFPLSLTPRFSGVPRAAATPETVSTVSRRRRSGFTLVELLLVLVILGILAAIVIPRFAGRSEQAKEQAAVTQISSLTTALNNFEVDNGYYPKSLNDLLAQPRDAQNWHGPYLQSDVIPKDPWGNDYAYKVPGSHNPSSFDLSSAGPVGGDKLFANWTIRK